MIGLTGRRAQKLAILEAPVFLQQVRGPYDRIVPLTFGEYIANTKPVVHFAVKEDDENRYFWYHVYHYRDTAWRWFKRFNHRNDFEGVILYQRLDGDIFAVASRYHYAVKTKFNPAKLFGRCWFTIEAKSHAISPMDRLCVDNTKAMTLYWPSDYGLIDMLSAAFPREWENIRRDIKPAQMPDEIEHGLWWEDPLRLLKKWSNIWDIPKKSTNVPKKGQVQFKKERTEATGNAAAT